MAKAVYTANRGLTVGIAQLGSRKDGRGSVAQEVHDGDTVAVDPFGNLGFRFLGVDAPEVSFVLPNDSQSGGGSEPIDSLAPQLYHRIADPDDRLFVAEQYLALFVSKGWKPVES